MGPKTAPQTEETALRFRLLGPFEVTRAGIPLSDREIGSRKGRTLLKLMLLRRGKIVPLDVITEVLWGENDPERADRLVATLVSRLRAVLGADSIRALQGGYQFVPSALTSVDADDAERLIAEAEARLATGQPALALAAAEGALELLAGGVLFEDEPDAEWAEEGRAAVVHQTTRARRCGYQSAMQLNDFAKAADLTEAAIASNPLDEDAYRALMQSHYHAGQTARAIACYERLRASLAEELGVDPAPETSDLHLAILRNELPQAELALVSSAAKAAPDSSFVGRDEEFAELAEAWARAVEGVPDMVLVTGEAGIGKTRLASEIAGLAAQTGGSIVQARCYEAERSLFLQPFVDAIRSTVLATSPDRVKQFAGAHAGALAEIVPEIGLMLRPRDYHPAPPDMERRRAFDAVAYFIRHLASSRPLMLFVDDLQNAGASTVEFIHFLMRHVSGARLMILATIRADEGSEALDQLADLGRRIDLGPLPDAAVTNLARSMGAIDMADRLISMTRGHTLFVVEALRAISEKRWTLEPTGVPGSLRGAVLARVGRAGPDVDELLRTAAILGSSFDPALVAAMLDVPFEEARRSVDRALEARLVIEGRADFEFANDLIREILYSTTPRPTRTLRHRRAATLLKDQPEALAVHAAAIEDWWTACDGWLGAAEMAANRYSNLDAKRLLDQALYAVQMITDPARESRVLLARGQAMWGLAQYQDAFVDFDRARELAAEAGDRALEMACLIALGGDVITGLPRPTTDCIPYLEDALAIAEELGEAEAEAKTLTRLAVIATNRLQFDRAYEYARRSEARAREFGDEFALMAALDGLKTVSAYAGDLDMLQQTVSILERLQRKHESLWHLQWTLFESSFVALAHAEWAKAFDRIDSALAVNRKTGHRAYSPMFLAHLGWIERARGNYGAALSLGRQAVDEAHEFKHPWGITFARSMLGWTLTDLYAHGEAIDVLEYGVEVAEHDRTEGYLARCLAHLGWAAHLAGDARLSTEAASRAEDILLGATALEGGAFLHGAHAYTATARTLIARGRIDAGERIIDLILDPAERVGWLEAAAEGRFLTAICALERGDPESAVAHLARAREVAARAGLPKTLWETLAARARVTDDESTSTEAVAIVERLAESVDDDEMRATYLEGARAALEGAV